MFNLLSKKSDSRDVAMERLGKVLTKDRSGCSADVVKSLGNDILDVLSNYMEFDKTKADIHITKEENSENPVLYAKIPIITMYNETMVNSPGQS
ncbi:MAG: cell division topological specificity factor MinE [Clostridiales bacterium]|nr:cell division topological specificity factor MinE [Clostridiales bacterium]